MKPLIVAQAPSRRSDPSEPLSGASGRRLAALAGMSHEEFLSAFERKNLVGIYPGRDGKGDRFPMKEAVDAANEIILHDFRGGRRIVLLGRTVATAFVGTEILSQFRLLQWHGDLINHGFQVALCPHPSGVSLWWNEPENVQAARAFWSALSIKVDQEEHMR